jgi:hypothetical protein
MIAFPLAPGSAAVAAYVVELVRALSAASGNVGAAAEQLRIAGTLPSETPDAARRMLDRRIGEIPGLRAWLSDIYPRSVRQPRKA